MAFTFAACNSGPTTPELKTVIDGLDCIENAEIGSEMKKCAIDINGETKKLKDRMASLDTPGLLALKEEIDVHFCKRKTSGYKNGTVDMLNAGVVDQFCGLYKDNIDSILMKR